MTTFTTLAEVFDKHEPHMTAEQVQAFTADVQASTAGTDRLAEVLSSLVLLAHRRLHEDDDATVGLALLDSAATVARSIEQVRFGVTDAL